MSDMRDTTTGASAAAGTGNSSQDALGGPGQSSSGTRPAAEGDETFGWTTSNDDTTAEGGDARATAERMLGQLQSMIDSVATQAAPMVRQIGVKAAELAAVAADRAGPLAHKAADATAGASERIAERSRTWAADLRTKVGDAAGEDGQPDTASRAAAAVDGSDDAIEDLAQDEPAEGSRGV